MEHRNLLDKMDLKKGTVIWNGQEYKLLDTNFPTVDPSDPFKLTSAEQNVISRLVHSFTNSKALARHMECLFAHGSLYLVHNNNLLYHVIMTCDKYGIAMAFTGVRLFHH